MEKVIKELRIIETDDGFRIEIKGDKEAMGRWKEHFRSCGPMNFGWHGRKRGMHHNHGMPFGPWAAGFRRHGFPTCCEGTEESETAEEE